MASQTQLRDAAIQVAATNVERAISLASKIGDPWFRSQALSWAAWHASEADFDKIIKKAVRSCFECEEPYQAVGSAAWPIRAMVECGHVDQAERIVSRALRIAEEIDIPVSRADALFLVWQAVYSAGQKLRRMVLKPLLAACDGSGSWKGAYLTCQIAMILSVDDPAIAQQVVDAMPEGKYKRQAQRRISEGDFVRPRAFFWI